jgi:hypothetical protein
MVDRQNVDAVLWAVRALTGVESDTCNQATAELIAQRPKSIEAPSADPGARRDLDGEDPAVIELENEVDLDAIVRAPMTGAGDSPAPRRLLEDLEHNAGIQQVAVLLQAGGVRSGELRSAEAEPSPRPPRNRRSEGYLIGNRATAWAGRAELGRSAMGMAHVDRKAGARYAR